METANRTTISLTTMIDAPVERVWQAWTDPALIMQWFGSDPNGTVEKAALDVRPGGHFEITFHNADRAEHTCSGTYTVVEKWSSLSFNWVWKSESGIESFVTVTLTPKDKGTLMQFQHADVWRASSHDYLVGWKSTFAKLERALAS